MKTEPKQLAAWRRRRGLSQAKAAAQLGVPLRTLQNWECGHRNPQGLAAVKLAELLTEKPE